MRGGFGVMDCGRSWQGWSGESSLDVIRLRMRARVRVRIRGFVGGRGTTDERYATGKQRSVVLVQE